MSIQCDVTACKNNDGRGNCELIDIYISDHETGDPICQDAVFEGEDEEFEK